MLNIRGFEGWADLRNQLFLRDLRNQKVSTQVFSGFLCQYHLLQVGVLSLQTSLLKHAPSTHRMVLANAITLTVEELDWLESLELPQEPAKLATESYLAFLESLDEQTYRIATLGHWARQRMFCDVWGGFMWQDSLAGEFAEQRLSPEAQALLHDLGSLTLEACEKISDSEARYWAEQVLKHEQAMWEMAANLGK